MKDELTIIPLGEAVAQMKTGSTPSTTHPEYFSGAIPWFTPGDIGLSKRLTDSVRTITQDAVSFGKAKLFEKGTLLVTCIGDIGRVGILQQTSSSNQQITALKFNDDIDADFAYYWFISNKQKLVDQANQAVVPILNNERLSEIKFAYPPLTEQKRIASLLVRADCLRQLRRTAHDLGDELLQSVFLEMFGDGSKFDRVEFEEILEESPKNGLYLSSDQYGSGTPIIRIDAFYDGVLGNPAFFKRLRATPKQIEEFNVQNDEILINRVNSLEYLGKCALVKGLLETTLFESNMMRIRINRKIANPVYVTKYLTTPEAYAQIMQKAKKAVNQASINQQDVKSIVIPVPPLSLQEEFAGVVARVESLRGRMEESTRQVEGLFESLLSESFGS